VTQRQLLTERWPRLFGAGAEGSRGLLSAIAGSMITVAGVTFSITVVALTLASSQYTSRILANFMRDRANQSVLVGEFLIEGMPLASLTAGEQARDERVIRALYAAYNLGKQRTVHQDAAYGIRQLVDVALKALSPGVNDTTTATNCIDYLGAILARMTDRQIAEPYRSDAGQLRLITSGPTFIGLLNGACDQIRQNAESNIAVLVRLLEILGCCSGVQTTSNAKTRSCNRRSSSSRHRTAAYPRRTIARQHKLHSTRLLGSR